jgi:hypothetical protein
LRGETPPPFARIVRQGTIDLHAIPGLQHLGRFHELPEDPDAERSRGKFRSVGQDPGGLDGLQGGHAIGKRHLDHKLAIGQRVGDFDPRRVRRRCHAPASLGR